MKVNWPWLGWWRKKIRQREFARAAEELLRAIPASRESGSSQDLEKDVTDFLEKFCDFSSDSNYHLIADTLYREFWQPRLTQYSPLLKNLVEGRGVKRHSVSNAISIYTDLLALEAEIPVLVDVIGEDWMCRHRSSLAALEGALRRSQRTPEAAQEFGRAARELESIPQPKPLDRANAAGFRSTSSLIVGFRYFGQRGIEAAEKAFRAFCCATKYARQRQWIYSERGLRTSRERLYHMRYWQYVAGIKLCLLRHRFDAARRRLTLGIQCAENLGYIPGERKWYESADDLRNDFLVIAAYERMIHHDDIGKASELLSEWVQRIRDVWASERRLCIYQLKVALDVLSFAMVRDDPARKKAFEELERLSENLRIVWGNELIFFAMRSFQWCTSDLGNTISLVKSAMIPGSSPERTPQISEAAKEQDCFLRMPEVFWRWLFRREDAALGSDELKRKREEICYTLLLYVRCVVEYWSRIYEKRRAEGEINRYARDHLTLGGEKDSASGDVRFPDNYGLTNWSELRICLGQLMARFTAQEAQGLKMLCSGMETFAGTILQQILSGKTGLTELVEFIKDLIMNTQDKTFPHVVLLNQCVVRQGRARLTLRRMWRGRPRGLTLRHVEPRTYKSELYYFLSPKFKRKAASQLDGKDVKLHPLGGSTCFGEPAAKPVLLLVEGQSDVTVFEEIFNRYNPHWQARITIRECGGAADVESAWEHYRAVSYGKVVAVLDAVGGSKFKQKIEKTANTHNLGESAFLLTPDLEGVQPEALTRALQEAHPGLWDEERVEMLLTEASKGDNGKGIAPAKVIKKYLHDGRLGEVCERDEQNIKNSLARSLAKHMLTLGPADKVMKITRYVLSCAFGHPK